ncbi:hypothetical protein GCM10009677_28640 [Sphaerisporangium rubeum]|uniref:DUF4082 domain-containing protein n=1 Tax=Sphaerisporangium rubeum TaxID=321317 RepID=A0A7X0IDJ3_9ACTN|nr:DUF4082 domain-containing protein [Sphaerisporangium rubeum]MBB6472973.1 hypothetical protein [Sphaerisporangium rubeum]
MEREPRTRRPGIPAVLAVLLIALGTVVVAPEAAIADQAPIDLGAAKSYGIIGGSAVTNTNNTSVQGDLGVSPGNTVTGFPPGTVSGTIHPGDSAAATAKAAVVAAYNDAASRTPVVTVPAQLGGTTKTPGVYTPPGGGGFLLSGTLTLDAQGDPGAVFLFRGSSLTTANVSNMNLVNGAQTDNVFFQVTGGATLGTFSTFRGNVIAQSSLTVHPGAALRGRGFTVNGGVTLQGTTTGPATLVIVPNDRPTATSVTASANPTVPGQAVTFAATVQATAGTVVPQGQLVFKDGKSIIDTETLDPSGQASFTTSALAPGQHSITAVYLGGDAFDGEALVHFAPSTSSPLVQVVTMGLWDNSATPAEPDVNETSPVVLGVKFRSAISGTVTGIRFYKGVNNTGTHVGSLWSAGGTLLASGTFTGETASGWQRMNFTTPVSISAGTTYVASYTTGGHWSRTLNYFTTSYTNDPLTAPSSGSSGGNGVYVYGSANAFPSSTYQASNYWVDVVFVPSESLWDSSATPAEPDVNETSPVVLGVKFRSTISGVIKGIRFYKGLNNTGSHVGSLWSAGGALLAAGTFTNESASGWQQLNFATPVSINANTTYIASYTTGGHWSRTLQYFTSQYRNGALYALADGEDGGNGVYVYGSANAFPSNTYQSSNYWVDVAFDIA